MSSKVTAPDNSSNSKEQDENKKEIATYQAPWIVNCMAWANTLESRSKYRLALSSYKEEYSNVIQIVEEVGSSEALASELNPELRCTSLTEGSQFVKKFEIDHRYPATKIMFAPASFNSPANKDYLITSGDYARLWSFGDDTSVKPELVRLMDCNYSELCAPVSSFDWSEVNTNVVCTVAVDTTCTMWDLNVKKPTTQLIAHDKEVFDVSFMNHGDPNIFATTGADGSIRLFDLRNLEHSTIIYETQGVGMMKVQWNKLDKNFLASLTTDGEKVVVIDVRMPSMSYMEMIAKNDDKYNAITWAPHSARHLAACSVNGQAVIWEVSQRRSDLPILYYNANIEVNQLTWSSSHEEYIPISCGDSVHFLRV